MANHYRILIVVFAHESQPLQSFLDALKTGGWRAHVEIPVPHEGECGLTNFFEKTEPSTCGTCERRAWGSMLFPDIRILTQEGVSEFDDCRHLPDFAHEHPFAQANAVISECSYTGFRRPERTDHIAVLIAESRGGVPHQWFEKRGQGPSFGPRTHPVAPTPATPEVGIDTRTASAIPSTTLILPASIHVARPPPSTMTGSYQSQSTTVLMGRSFFRVEEAVDKAASWRRRKVSTPHGIRTHSQFPAHQRHSRAEWQQPAR